MGDLLGLAERFVRLSAELEQTRAAMLASLMNGAGDNPKAPFARPARPSSGLPAPQCDRGERSGIRDHLALLRAHSQPNLTTSAITKATKSRPSTVSERLRRPAGEGRNQRRRQRRLDRGLSLRPGRGRDLIAPAPPASAPWVKPLSRCRTELGLSRFG